MNRSGFKRTLSLLLTLAMLCGMVAVMGAFPAAAAAEVEKFKANFSELPTGTVSLTDTETVNWLTSKFAFMYFQEGRWFERPNVNGYVVDADGNNLTARADKVVTYIPDVVNKGAGASYQWVDGTGYNGSAGNHGYGFSYWTVSGAAGSTYSKWLSCTGFTYNGGLNRKANTMWVKSADGDLAKLKNFTLDMDFMPTDETTNRIGSTIGNNTYGMGNAPYRDTLSLFFRADVAGNVYDANMQMLVLEPSGKFYAGQGMYLNKADLLNGTMPALDRSTAYHLTLTVVGNQMKATVYNGSKKIWSTTCDMAVDGAGYIGIGGSCAGARYGSIEITRLNDEGDPVDFGDETDGYGFGADFDFLTHRTDDEYGKNNVGDTYGSQYYYNGKAGVYYKNNGKDAKWLEYVGKGNITAAFDDTWYVAKGTTVRAYLEDRFSFYFNQEGGQLAMETPYQTSEELKAETYAPAVNGGACAQWKLTQNGYLMATYVWAGGEMLRKTLTIAPKTASGDFSAKNFVTEFDYKIGDTSKTESGVLLTFRSAEAGRVINGGNNNSFADKVTLVFHAKGIGIYDNERTAYTYKYSANYKVGLLNADGNPTEQFTLFDGNATVSEAHVYAKAVGNQLWLTVTDLTTGTVVAEKQVALDRAEAGYLYYTTCNYDSGLANIRVDRLDEEGNAVGFEAPESFTLATAAADGDITSGSETETYLKGKVDSYYDNDGTLSSAPFVSTDGVGTFSYVYDKKFQGQIPSAHRSAETHLKAVATMVPKTDNGKAAVMKNFEMSFTTRWAEGAWNGYPNASVVIGGRQQTAGKFTTAAGQVESKQGVIVISSTGITIAGGSDLTDDIYTSADAETFASALSPSGDWNSYKVKVRVVGSKVTVTIGDKTYSGIWNYSTAGYLAMGISGRSMQLGDITVTRLDDNGNAADWNEAAEEVIPTGWSFTAKGLTSYRAATTVAQRTEYLNAFDSAFDVYYNDYNDGAYDYRHNASVVGNTVGYNYGWLTGEWMELNLTPTGYGDDDMQRPQTEMRQIGTLVPKDSDGEPLYLKNFELRGRILNHLNSVKSTYGAAVVGFRMDAPGKYLNEDGTAAQASYMLFTTDGAKVYENGSLIHEKAFASTYMDSQCTFTIRVVGNKLTYTYAAAGKETISDTVTLSTDCKGYLGYGQTTRRHIYSVVGSNMYINALDANGNATPIKEPAKPYGNGDLQIAENTSGENVVTTVTVTPDEGFELKAGSLIAVDEDGNRYVPMRVGFRNGGDASQYTVTAPTSVTFKAEFIKPTTANPNLGNVGVSVNTTKYGVRFVSRLNRTVTDGVEYITLDGKKVAVKDYGMLIAAESVIGNGVLLTDELAAENSRVKKLSVVERQIYFDYCDDYVDMSACITNIDKVEGGLSMKLVARAYAVTTDNKTLYADMVNSTYERVSGMKSVSFAALTAAGQVLATGRAGQVGSEFQMDWVNSGFEISGDLVDSLRVKMTSNRVDSLLNVQVDGGEATIVHVPQGTSTVTLAGGLTGGEHTVRVIGGTSLRFGTLSATELQYNGTLNEVKRDGTQLRLEVLGDSISCGWGLDMPKGQTYTTTEQVAGSNSYYSYAGVAARELGADLSVVAQCSQTISEVNGYWKKLNKRSGAAAWDFASHQQDVVVVNLGTNDEWRSGYQDAAKALTDAKALLADVRAAYPEAYIIWAYNMMEAKAEFAASYLAAVQSMNDGGDNKVFALRFDSDKTYYEGHPSRASHEKNGKELAAFIRANCTELFGHTTHTETIGALTAASKVIFNGRTTASGTARTMDLGSTGITISGYLYGKLSMNINFGNTSYNSFVLNVMVDNDADNAKQIWVGAGNTNVTLLEGLGRGHHRVEITRGAGNCGTLTMKDITYTGTLETPTVNPLQIEFLGDSITASDGMMNGCYGAPSMNTFIGYAAKTARAIGANVNNVAVSGWKTAQVRDKFNNWTGDDVQKQIVVINLGTNDFGWSTSAAASTQAGLKDTCLGLIGDVRAKYGADTYIIWAYGMMFDKDKDFPAAVVEEYRTTNNDERVLWCDLSSAKNNAGYGQHPNVAGNAAAAQVLTGFIQTNCADVLS